MTRCVCEGSLPAFQAMTASTANSGSVCSHARMARARPWETRNCAASAPQAIKNDESRMLGKVQSAERTELFAIIGAPAGGRIVIDDHKPPEPTVSTRARAQPRARRGDRDTRTESVRRRG